jgi:sucrose-6F-phosphate phosphohydrolase
MISSEPVKYHTSMTDKLLVCTDLDRTLIPNGPQPESPQARPLFRQLCAQENLTLAYVSGRHKELVEEAISEYDLPIPDYVVGDVGTTIYQVKSQSEWSHFRDWESDIGKDWNGLIHSELSRLFDDLIALKLQESEKQNRYKLSYYASLEIDRDLLDTIIQQRLQDAGVSASLIWSVDEMAEIGLLDLLPASATKLHAVEFLMQRLGFSTENTLYSGDSGNDMPVLLSEISSVLVNNAQSEVKEEAAGYSSGDSLYFAKGGFMQMNGNYSAGILEGLAHYHPALAAQMLNKSDNQETQR